MYCLDTNTCIYYLNGKYENIRAKLLSLSPTEVAIPSIVKAELILGAYKSKKKSSNLEKVELFLAPFQIIPFDDRMTYVYAEIQADIEKRGHTIGPNDLFIASIVKCTNGILVTNNMDEFRRVKGLLVENWAK